MLLLVPRKIRACLFFSWSKVRRQMEVDGLQRGILQSAARDTMGQHAGPRRPGM